MARVSSHLAAALLVVVSAPSWAKPIVDKDVREALARNAPVAVVVHMKDQYNLANLPNGGSFEKRIDRLVATLKDFNLESSKRVREFLTSDAAVGVEEVTPIWITNSVRVKAPANVIEQLTAMNSIEQIQLDAPKEVEELGAANASFITNVDAEPQTSWGLTQVRAPEMWAKGFSGQGIKVAVIDTGANITHPDLAPALWKNPGETGTDETGKDKATNGVDDDKNGFVDDVNGFNFESKNGNVVDNEGHGSQTAGIVGGVGTGGIKTGVAPKATLVIVKSCCGSATQIFESNTWEALQYAVVTKVRVISMSLSAKYYSNPQYAKWRRAGEVVLAAGVIHVNSAGNLGSGAVPKNVGAPCSNPPAWFHPLQTITGGKTSMITVGATDEDDKLRSYSSTGPVTWEAIAEYKDYGYEAGKKQGLTKPEVCGPSEVPSTEMTGTGYSSSFGGTSSATPNVAGVVTLLLSARPDLTVEQVTQVMMMSAKQIEGEAAFNNKCGAGRVDAVAALDYANEKFPVGR